MTKRRALVLGTTAALILTVIAAVIFDSWQVALVAVALLQAGTLVIAVDARAKAKVGTEFTTQDALTRVRQTEALMQLFRRVAPRAQMPSSSGAALDATNILTLLDLIQERRPRLVVELGSGTSSIWLGYALEQIGAGSRLVSVESDTEFAAITEAQVRKHALGETVEVRTARLVDPKLPNHKTPWYDMEAFEDIEEIDLLIVDGPPGPSGPMSRYPALPKLMSRLSDTAAVALDDTDRPDEQEAVRRWLEETPGLRGLTPTPEHTLTVLNRVPRRGSVSEAATGAQTPALRG